MPIINTQTIDSGNFVTRAAANIESQLEGPDGYFYCGLGTQLQINAETFDKDGVSEGIQGLDYTIDGTEEGYNAEIGGIRVYDLVRGFTNAISSSWSPQVDAVPAENTRQVSSFRLRTIKDGAVRIRDWVYVNAPLSPAA